MQEGRKENRIIVLPKLIINQNKDNNQHYRLIIKITINKNLR